MKGAKSASGGSKPHAQRRPFLNGATMDSEAPGSPGEPKRFACRNHARFVRTWVLSVTVSDCALRPRF